LLSVRAGLAFSEKPIHLPKKATGAPEKLALEAPGSGLSVAQPNPSVANLLTGTIAAVRYKQMTASQKNGDVSVEIR